MQYAEVDKRRSEQVERGNNFWDHHHEIVRRLLLGQKAVDIAHDLGLHPQTVSNVRNSPLVQRQLAVLQQQRTEEAVTIAEQIREIAPKAVQALDDAMSDPDSPWNAKVAAAKDVLDRAGYAPVRRTENVNAHLTLEELEAIKARAKARGVVVCTNAEEVEDAE